MSKTKSKILLSIFIILTLVSSFCFATVEPRTSESEIEATSEDATTVSEEATEQVTEDTTSDWVNSDLYISQDVVTIDKVVDGNVFIIGQEVTISGEIGGDLFVLADKLNIEGGYIYSNLFACANEITINGVVYDVYAVCDTLNLENNGFIYRDLKVTANDVNFNGRVRRDAHVGAANLSFSEDLGTLIYGNLNYSSESEISVPEGVIAGEVKYTAESVEEENNIGSTILSYVLDLLQNLVLTFVVTLLLIWLTPKFVERVGKMGVGKSFASLGIGFITPIVLIVVSILLLISTVGASIFAIGIFAFIILAFIGTSVASIFFGKLFTKLLKMEGNVKFVLFTLVSNLILWAIAQIPVVGGFFGFFIAIFGIGTALVNMVYRKEKEVAVEKVEEK